MVGTFQGLAQFAGVVVNGINFFVTYTGGDGNDVSLIQADARVFVDVDGNLVVTTVGTANDNITVTYDAANQRYTFSNLGLTFFTNIGAGTTGNNTDTLTVDEAAFDPANGTIQIRTGGGSDTLTIDLSTNNVATVIEYDGGAGAGSDSLVLTGGARTFADVTHTFENASTGTVDVTGNAQFRYTGLEPITDNLDAANRVFDFTAGDETITLTDAAGATMTIDSDQGESVTFATPTTSLTITSNNGTDVIQLNSVDADAPFDGNLTVTTGAGSTIQLNGATLDIGAGTATLTAGTIAFGGGGLTTTGTVSLNAGAGGITADSDGAATTEVTAATLTVNSAGNVGAAGTG